MNLLERHELLKELVKNMYEKGNIPEGMPEAQDDNISLEASDSIQKRIMMIFEKEGNRQHDSLIRFMRGETFIDPPECGMEMFQIQAFDGIVKLSKRFGYFKAKPVLEAVGADIFDEIWNNMTKHFSDDDIAEATLKLKIEKD